MKVYFTASMTGGRKYVSQFRLIYKTLTTFGHQVWGKHIADPKMTTVGERKKLSASEIYEREKKRIEEADIAVIEVTTPSTGIGMMVAYALSLGKPVLALFYGSSPDLLSPMIAGNPAQTLYLEHYDKTNLDLVLKRFFEHLNVIFNRKGKLIVMDGGDGSGKTTQTDLLIDYLKRQKIPVKYFHFPRYYTSFHGKVVGRYLSGEFGDVHQVSPYLTSLIYAIDRAGAAEEMNNWLLKGGIVLTDRYVQTSMAYMAAKLEIAKREEFMKWLDELEYRVHRLPREDLVIYLDVPARIGQDLTDKKGERWYIGGVKRDIHERNLTYLEEVEKIYAKMIQKNKNWIKVDCFKNKTMKTKEEIHREILKILKEKKII